MTIEEMCMLIKISYAEDNKKMYIDMDDSLVEYLKPLIENKSITIQEAFQNVVDELTLGV